MTNQDSRCCGTGVCIINEQGQCWCGQLWDGQKMVAPTLPPLLQKNTPDTPRSNDNIAE